MRRRWSRQRRSLRRRRTRGAGAGAAADRGRVGDAWARLREDESGQSVLESAVLMVPFVVAFLICIQLALVVVYRWQHNHLAFQAARQHSVRWITDPSSAADGKPCAKCGSPGYINDPITGAPVPYSSPRTAMNWTALAYYMSRETPEAAFIAMTANLEADPAGGGVIYTGKIPLMIPGAAQLMAAEDDSLAADPGFTSFINGLVSFDAGQLGQDLVQHLQDLGESFVRIIGLPAGWDTPNSLTRWKSQLLEAALQGKVRDLSDFDAIKSQLLFQRFLEVRFRIPIAPEPTLMRHDFIYCGDTTEPPCADNDRL